MKLALEARTDMLEMVQPFADFDWILAHKVLEDEGYAKFYKESDKPRFIDNSVNEIGEPVSIEDMKKVWGVLGGGYIVAPDWIGDATKTVEAYGKCVEEFGEENVVGVLQGGTFQEALGCLNVFRGMVAVPYDIGSKKKDPPWLMALRRILVVSNIPSDRYIHLLGFTSIDELWWYTNRPNVVSIDTGIPILLGLQGLDILDPLEGKEEPTYNRMDKLELTQDGWTAICRNIALLRRYLP